MVFMIRSPLLALTLFLLYVPASQGFVPYPRSTTTTLRTNESSSSTTALSLFEMFNEGKKILVRNLAGDFDETAIKGRLNGLVADNKVLMLSFTTCPFCIKAKGILDAKPTLQYTVVELDQDADGKAIRAVMGDMLGRTSVPALWIDGRFVGGCNDGGPEGKGIVQLDESGELDSMLRAAQVM